MNKINLYEKLGLNQYYWGGASETKNAQFDITSKIDVLDAVDKICSEEGLSPLGDEWNQINYNDFKKTLTKALQYNLGFTNFEVMPHNKAIEIYTELVKNFNEKECLCFTNWFNNPWEKKNTGSSFNSVSDNTMDMVICIVDNKRLLFIYFLFED